MCSKSLSALFLIRVQELLSLVGVVFLFVSCGVESKQVACTASTKRVFPLSSVVVSDLSPAFFSASTPRQMTDFLETNPSLLWHFFELSRYPNLAYLSRSLSQMVQNPHIDSLRKDVENHYGDLSNLQEQLAIAWGGLQAYDTSFVAPVLQTIITGLYKDLYLSDSLIIVGLDYFLGPSARYPPKDVPMYLLRRLTPQYLVPTLLFYFSERYNRTNISDQTLLSDMVAMGKTYAFVQKIFPCISDSTLLGYTASEMQAIQRNEATIWAYFLHNQLLYEVNPQIKEKFVGERPKVYEIDETCPGRIGHWLGWQIVRSYLGKRGDDLGALRVLMEEEDAKKVLTLSKYSPID